ncbi:MarR family winged helix-turn-helix transcriptional regulator [Ekhidna sp.]
MSNYLKAILEVIKTGHWITDQVSIELKEFDITEPQFNVLRILNGRNGKPVTVQEIQSQMVQRSSNVTRIIDKLLDKQFVERKECPSNRRKMDITITQSGVDHLKILDQKLSKFHSSMKNNLSNTELEQLTELIKKLKGETK